jgi:hypothetical protein
MGQQVAQLLDGYMTMMMMIFLCRTIFKSTIIPAAVISNLSSALCCPFHYPTGNVGKLTCKMYLFLQYKERPESNATQLFSRPNFVG